MKEWYMSEHSNAGVKWWSCKMDKLTEKNIRAAAQFVAFTNMPNGENLLNLICEFQDEKSKRFKSVRSVCDFFYEWERKGFIFPEFVMSFVAEDERILHDWFCISIAAYELLHGKKRGGYRWVNPGGSPLKNPEKGKRAKRAITLRADHDEKIKSNRSEIIESALDFYFSNIG